MKLKFSHPAMIVVVSVLASQLVTATVNTVITGINEVQESIENEDDWALSNFSPFRTLVNKLFKPIPVEEDVSQNPFGDPAQLEDAKHIAELDIRLYKLEMRLETLEQRNHLKPER